jgi:uncharacterized membrane protein
MIVKLLLKSWPVLLPIIIYLIWLYKETRKKDIKVQDEFNAKKKKYMFYALSSCAIIVVLLLLFYALTSPKGDLSEKKYSHKIFMDVG